MRGGQNSLTLETPHKQQLREMFNINTAVKSHVYMYP